MDFITTKEAALKWGLTNRMVQVSSHAPHAGL